MEKFTRLAIPGKQRGKVRNNRVVLGVLTLITIALIVATSLLGIQMKEQKDELMEFGNICNSKECVTAAGDMINAMDLTASPCDDFFQFSCGGWLKNNPETLWIDFDYLWSDHLDPKLKEIVERKIDESDLLPLNLAKQFYSSCMAQNTTGHEELSDLLERVLEETKFRPNELGEKLGELRAVVAGNFIISTYVYQDEENTSRHVLYVDQPTLGLNRIYLVESPQHAYKTAYVELIEEIWELIYPDVVNKTEIAMQLVEFETKLAEISTKEEDRFEQTTLYNPMTIRELSELTQNVTMINWEKYIEETFQGVEEVGNIHTDLRVIVRDIPYFTELGNVLKNVTEESPAIIWNYLKWRTILKYAKEVNNQFRDILFNYEKKTWRTDRANPPPRWQVCLDEAYVYFEMAMNYHHLRDAFTSDFQRNMAEMIGNIQQAFNEILTEIDWFGKPETRVKAKQKAEKMTTFAGYPVWLLNSSHNHSALREEYEGEPETLSDNHFQNMLELRTWTSMYYLKYINRTKNPSKCISDRTVLNAFYSSKYNSITFPGGILRPPFFFTGKPIQALNYGAIGVAISHEITHGFDDKGRQSDGDGNLVDRWDEETVTRYTEKAQCFIDQYCNYTPEEADNMTLNGNKTIYENIADNGGIRLAFRAYQSFVRKNGVEPRLPGLSYSPEQLFFIALSQIWCGAHSKFRVRGVLHNSIEFAEAWNCPKPSDHERCRIW